MLTGKPTAPQKSSNVVAPDAPTSVDLPAAADAARDLDDGVTEAAAFAPPAVAFPPVGLPYSMVATPPLTRLATSRMLLRVLLASTYLTAHALRWDLRAWDASCESWCMHRG